MAELRFSYVPLGSGLGGTAAALSRLPEVPALYAFFRRATLAPQGDAEQFSDALLELIGADMAPEHTGRFGPLHTAVLGSRPMLPPSLEDRVREFCKDLASRTLVAELLELATPLQAPLYVGKTTNLRRRIGSHTEPMSDLSVRLREAGLSIDRTLLAYCLLDDQLDDTRVLFLEAILTYYCRPGFVLRPG